MKTLSSPDSAEARPVRRHSRGGRHSPVAIVSLTVLGLFAVLCLLHLHGFSLPVWHELIDHSEPVEILYGQARFIRADDWAVSLPLALSQTVQSPRFPVVNRLIGVGGASNLVGYSVPMTHWLSLFRPHLWGYFLGRDLGLAWNWWFRALLLFYAWFLVFWILSRGRVWLSVLAGIALLYAPFFQYWAMNYEPMTGMIGLCFVACAGLISSRSRRSILLYGLLLAWAGGSFVLGAIYPPFQIGLGYLLLALLTGTVWRERRELSSVSWKRLRLGAALIALLCVVAAVALYLRESWSIIRVVSETVYPGKRIAHGGDLTLPHLLGSVFSVFGGETLQSAFGNICEGASFYFLSPLIVGFVLWEWRALRRKPDSVVVAVSCCLLLLFFYALLGAPAALARLTGLSLVPGVRTLLALGVGDMVLVVLLLSQDESARTKRGAPVALVLAGLWAICALAVASRVAPDLPGPSSIRIAGVGAGLLAIGTALLLRRRLTIVLIAAVTVSSTIWFNPLVRGGTDFLMKNALSQAIIDLDHATGGKSRWVVCDDSWLANLFRIIGVRAVNGVHYYPLFDLWSRLDPGGQAQQAYNRYAHVEFWIWPKPGEIQMVVPYPDRVQVMLFPNREVMTALGADYILCVGNQAELLRGIEGLMEVRVLGDKHVFQVR